MGSRSKGRATVRKGKKVLEHNGWKFGEAEAKGKFREVKDMFGMFDNVAVKDRDWLMIQFKTNSRGVQKAYKQFAKEHGSRNVHIQLWNWIDYKGFEIIDWDSKGKRTKCFIGTDDYFDLDMLE